MYELATRVAIANSQNGLGPDVGNELINFSSRLLSPVELDILCGDWCCVQTRIVYLGVREQTYVYTRVSVPHTKKSN